MKNRMMVGLCVVVLAGLSGCASPARVIKSDPTSVVIAVPDDSNSWPFHYRDEATAVAKTYINDPRLVSTNRVKVGESITNSTNATRQDLGGQNKQPKFGEIVNTSNVTSVRDEYEYHLEFQAGNGGIVKSPMTMQPLQPGNVTPAGGTTPARREAPDTRLPAVNPPGNVPPGSFPATGLPGR